ncbi:unnamed protein product [Didymodactylos carnosus]|uniref:Uncharacterized protein n=1 Tax=Didymodactylos carnosus TaxID=1234261 RepID=A0A8S2QLD3_9BILA|nr:unnamed protein product [Didymodactylos carnosus]CAF4111864.1 unnamed protein product [Didymodactylos carnosus]
MGASGAGKTTLMNVLTARRPGKLKITGDVRVNGSKMGRNISRVAGYVQQEELFIPSMTTREHLIFHAMLRMNKDMTKEQRLLRVEEVLDFLNLKKVEKTLIGTPGRIKGLSGGEKRRLTFASEPTSGLDSSMAFIISDAMRKLANQGKTIVCTIHQPSSEIFQLFDTLYLLAEGRLAYFGLRTKAQEFFGRLDYTPPEKYNPSDYYIQTLAILPYDREACLERVEYICDEYERSPMYSQRVAEVQQFHAIEDDQTISGLFKSSPKYKAGFFTQLRWLMWRSFKNMVKNPFELRLHLILAVIVGVMLGLLFIRLKYNQQAPQNMSSVIFVLLINISFTYLKAVANSYAREYPVFFKEHDDNIYRTFPYYISRFLIELPVFALGTFILATIVYWLTNLYDNVRRYFILMGILILTELVATSAGSIIAVISPTFQVADALVVPIVIPLMVFGGFFINAKTIPKWLIWIKYISWFYYGNEMALVNQWTDVKYLQCNRKANSNTTCFRDGNDVLKLYGFSKTHYNRDLGLLFVLFISFRLISLTILALKAKYQRSSA